MSKIEQSWITASLTAALLSMVYFSAAVAAEGVVRISDRSPATQLPSATGCDTDCTPAAAPAACDGQAECAHGCGCNNGNRCRQPCGNACGCRHGMSFVGPAGMDGMGPHQVGLRGGMLAGGIGPRGGSGLLRGGSLNGGFCAHGCLRCQCPFGCRGGLERLFPNLVPGGRCTYAPGHGWAPPVKVPLEQVPIGYQRYYPSQWYGMPNGQAEPYATAGVIGVPTDTTQLGYYYQRVPTWYPAPHRIPHPNPSTIHSRFCPSSCPCKLAHAGYIIDEAPTAEPTPAEPSESEPPPAPVETSKTARVRREPAAR